MTKPAEELKRCPFCGRQGVFCDYGFVQCPDKWGDCESMQKWPLRTWNDAYCWKELSKRDEIIRGAMKVLKKMTGNPCGMANCKKRTSLAEEFISTLPEEFKQ